LHIVRAGWCEGKCELSELSGEIELELLVRFLQKGGFFPDGIRRARLSFKEQMGQGLVVFYDSDASDGGGIIIYRFHFLLPLLFLNSVGR
jgi:hypothetical protein